ncbi:MAG TPA: family 10 glycosylhydrolase [Candidatus Omnitrophota bacterium]|nr:family 10 glycosylhydrolase [Candidatus Omnitrophota bacterium]
MRRSNSILLAIFLCASIVLPVNAKAEEPVRRAIYVSLIQDPPVLSKLEDILKLIEFSRESGIDDIFIQVYRANRSWFLSDSADSGPYIRCVNKMSEDPLDALIKHAHDAGIKVHAWLNLLSLSANAEAPILQKYGPEILTRNLQEKKAIEDYRIDNQYFLEPGDVRVRSELAKVVYDLLSAYPGLDGIQFDYIRYPDQNPTYGYTDMNIERFKRATGYSHVNENSGVWKDWKRKQVTELLNLLVRTTRAVRPDITVSVTGCASYIRAYYEAYQDWPYWLNSGLVDSVTFMSYTKDADRFKIYVYDAKALANDFKKVNIAIGAYDMADSPPGFAKQIEIAKGSGASGFVILHYGNLSENRELAGLLKK